MTAGEFDEFDTAEPPPPRQRSTVVSVRLNDEELESLQKYATDHGLTISGSLRALAIEAAHRSDESSKDLTIAVHRENGLWWAAIRGHNHVVGGNTFEELSRRLNEALHLSGLSREQTVFSVKWYPPSAAAVNTTVAPAIVLWDRAP